MLKGHYGGVVVSMVRTSNSKMSQVCFPGNAIWGFKKSKSSPLV